MIFYLLTSQSKGLFLKTSKGEIEQKHVQHDILLNNLNLKDMYRRYIGIRSAAL